MELIVKLIFSIWNSDARDATGRGYIAFIRMELEHPIDAALRAWLKAHVPNHAEMSVSIGRSSSWLHKWVNGAGDATLDDLVRIAALLFGVNVPRLTDDERKLLKALRGLNEGDRADVLAYAEHRRRLAQRAPSKESSAPAAERPPAKAHRARGTR